MGCGGSAQVKPAPQNQKTHGDNTLSPVVPQAKEPQGAPAGNSARKNKEHAAEPEQEPDKIPKSGLDTKPQRGEGPIRSQKPTASIQVSQLKATRQKHKDSPSSRSHNKDNSTTVEKKQSPSSGVDPKERRFLQQVMANHFIFAGMPDEEINAVIECMTSITFTEGQVVFNQGDEGDSCYFIASGSFDVVIDNSIKKRLQKKHTFGELAMLYEVKRTATVVCRQAGVIWKMGHTQFRTCMETVSKSQQDKVLDFFKADPNFAKLKEEHQRLLATACTIQPFEHGERIIRRGELTEWLFIVMEGKVVTTDEFGSSTIRSPGDILGVEGLKQGKQTLEARAAEAGKCLALGKGVMDRLFGDIQGFLRQSTVKTLLEGKSFFIGLSAEQQHKFVEHIHDHVFQPGETVVAKGSAAQFGIVMEGELVAYKEDQDESGAEKLTPFSSYGDSALPDGQMMPTHIKAVKTTRVFRIGKESVTHALGHTISECLRANEITKVLKEIFLFKTLKKPQIAKIVRSLEQKKFKEGDIIVQQGDVADNFYLIQYGTINVTKDSKALRVLGKWDYFGERALLSAEKRTATCQAQKECACLVLGSAVFLDIVGMFKKDLEHRMKLQDLNISLSDLKVKAIVGRGGFGVVRLVHHKSDPSKVYALKAINKQHVIQGKQQQATRMERTINAQCYHPCIMQFIKTMQDAESVYFLTEFLGGGDLFFAIREIGMLTKKQSQFFISSITLALEYLHERDIIYRDLKPENVILDFNGYAKLVDFGCCKQAKRTYTLLGTPQYMSPEVIKGKGYGCNTDWWSLGVMMYEFVVGPLPFTGSGGEDDQLEIFRQILQAPLTFPSYVKDEAAIAVMSGLMERIPELRMCATSKGIQELQEHAYFSGFDWDGIAGTYMDPPWKPNVKRIKENWEAADCDHLSDSSVIVDDPEMEWAKDF
eukprot:gnl/MRDRNA2_/MRDRNA2_83579_c0_seq2.p1 gnl/MRDRNA2_/MRDRNA2_83579_c0~~gnl/MRDRNA2_/MRDRNA2_83579_c0_seq2.p1  ORF type:complete len:934 (-),score=200.73 gnl/MRDRNA2_/MRDRNA2_83579_c0_seq2:24-2825(-)